MVRMTFGGDVNRELCGEKRTYYIKDAEAAGVKSVPALVLDGQPFHINFGAGLDALK